MSTIKTTSNIEHTVCDRTVCEAVGVSEYVYVNVDAWVEITVNGRPLTVNFQNGHSFKGNNYSCPSNKFIVSDNSDNFLSKLDRLSDDADQDEIDEMIEASGGVLTSADELWALKLWLSENTPSLSDFDLSDDIDDYEVEVDEFGHKFVVQPIAASKTPSLSDLTLDDQAYVDNFGTDGGVAWQQDGVDAAGNRYRVMWLPTAAWQIAERFAKAEIAGDEQLMAEIIEENGGDSFVDVQDQSNACDWDEPWSINLID